MRSLAARLQSRGPWLALIALCSFPILSGNAYYIDVATYVGIAAVMAIGLGLLYGYAGQISFAQGAFYGLGAYGSALLTTELGAPFGIGLLVGMALPAIAAVVVGIPTLRLRGHYLAIATLALQVSFTEAFEQLTSITNGTVGVFGIERPSLFGLSLEDNDVYYVFVVVIALIVLFFAERLVHSRFGRALAAIREDEVAAGTLGIDAGRYKLIVFALSATLAGLAGTLYAYKIQFISPVAFDLNQSIVVLSMVVIGGLGSNWGAVSGAVVVTLVTQLLFSTGTLSFLIYGAWIVAVMVLFPAGLAGLGRLARDLVKRLFESRRGIGSDRTAAADA